MLALFLLFLLLLVVVVVVMVVVVVVVVVVAAAVVDVVGVVVVVVVAVASEAFRSYFTCSAGSWSCWWLEVVVLFFCMLIDVGCAGDGARSSDCGFTTVSASPAAGSFSLLFSYKLRINTRTIVPL